MKFSLKVPDSVEEIERTLTSDARNLARFGLAVIQCSRVDTQLRWWAVFHFKDATLKELSGPLGTQLSTLIKKGYKHEILDKCSLLNKKYRIFLAHGIPTEEWTAPPGATATPTGKTLLTKNSLKSSGFEDMELTEEFANGAILSASEILQSMRADFQSRMK